MLSVKEKAFAEELLAYLDIDDLTSLTKTTTNDVVVPTSKSDAVSAILLHTETIHVLLSRKKITKEVLFKYLHDRQQSVSLSETKDNLRKHILGLLGISDKRRSVRFETDNYNQENRSDDSGAGSDVSGSEDNGNGEGSNYHCGVHLHNSNPQAESAELPYVSWDRGSYASSIGTVDVVQHTNDSDSTSVQIDFPVIEFSQQFVSWFYNLLNAGGVEEEHFWADAVAEMLLLPGGQVSHGSTANGVSQLLGWVRNQLGLTFNPNVTGEGIRGRFDPHGLMIVIVCGTLHTPDRCIGVFTQQFALARDPFSNNNWKVKNTKGILRCPGNALEEGTFITPTLDNVEYDLSLLEPS